MISFNCSRCGASVPALQRHGSDLLCGGCYHGAVAGDEARRVAQVEELQKRVAELESALSGARSERKLLEEEIARCRSTGTPAAPAAMK